ncbi:hypothetical protein EDB84DRAFT_1604955 [Lactarius hengduanensis]|nr:hypothetical protein EDB84DRAFT_1604955 [Lactarius hengduanensis]
MKEAWARDNANKIVAWEAQLEQDRIIQNELERVAQEAEAEQLAQREKEAEEQRKEAEKKKPRMNSFDPRRCLAQYAINKINNLEWVELDYFTLKGCRDAAADSSKSTNQDAFAFAQLGNSHRHAPASRHATLQGH